MAFRTPLTRYRPTKTKDDEGGFTEALGTGITLYATCRIHDNKIKALVDPQDDVIVEDIVVEASGAKYRVIDTQYLEGTRHRELTLERMDRPINP